MQTQDQIRRDQSSDHQRRLTLSVSKFPVRPNTAKKPFVAKGHDAILKNLQDTGAAAIITLLFDGRDIVGRIVARDKFTITIEEQGNRRTFYKHAIESFGPAPAQVE